MAAEIDWKSWPGFGPTALDQLTNYIWPGNVRELRNVAERAVYRWERQGPIDAIQIDPFKSPFRPKVRRSRPRRLTPAADAPAPAPPPPSGFDEPSDFKNRVARFERELLARALAEQRFNQRATADALGLSYDQLRHALKRHELLGGG